MERTKRDRNKHNARIQKLVDRFNARGKIARVVSPSVISVFNTKIRVRTPDKPYTGNLLVEIAKNKYLKSSLFGKEEYYAQDFSDKFVAVRFDAIRDFLRSKSSLWEELFEIQNGPEVYKFCEENQKALSIADKNTDDAFYAIIPIKSINKDDVIIWDSKNIE